MKVERILSESDLLAQRINSTSRKKRESVLTEDAVSFEGKEQRKDTPEEHYPAYGPKKGVSVPPAEGESVAKEDIDVVV